MFLLPLLDKDALLRREKILHWLSQLDFLEKQNTTLAKHVQGTGQWLLESDRFREWLHGSENFALWCAGMRKPHDPDSFVRRPLSAMV